MGAKYVAYCDTHEKELYHDRNLARQSIRGHHDPGMREYQCTERSGYWHVGHLPKAVREGRSTTDEYYNDEAGQDSANGVYSTPSSASKPLTYTIPAEVFKPLNGNHVNGHTGNGGQPQPAEPTAAENSIESLLFAAEESGNAAARKLAEKIRALASELIDLIRTSAREQELRDLVAQRRRLLDEALQELADLKAPAKRVQVTPKPDVDSSTQAQGANMRGVPQGLVREWARQNGMQVGAKGALSATVIAAYERSGGAS